MTKPLLMGQRNEDALSALAVRVAGLQSAFVELLGGKGAEFFWEAVLDV